MDYSYWDYVTGKVSGSDIFDINSTGNDKIDVLKDPKYYEKYKNLKGYITKMTPKEYFQKCAEIFNTSFDHQVNRIGVEKDYIQHLKSVITLKKDKFPMTYLDFANETQEGRHRMFVAGELFGWDTKFPVLIVDYADKQRSEEEK